LKAALIIVDGMADRSQESLGRRTPLQAAVLPNLDRLARISACGHMYPVGPGICPSSDQAHWRILGYGRHPFPGRASIEAIGAGVELSPGDVVVRVTLATTMLEENNRYIQVAPAYLPEDQATAIFSSLVKYKPEYLEARIHHMGGPFMVIVLSGGASAEVTDSDPLFFRLPVRPIVAFTDAPGVEAEDTASELTRFTSWAADVLESHPVNAGRKEERMTLVNHVLIKWPSVPPSVPSFSSAWGFDSVAVASGVFYAGLARALGMRHIEAGAIGVAEDLGCKLDEALGALRNGCDFAFVHTKAADEASHTGRPRKKVRALEELDQAFELVVEQFARDPELLTVVTADHPSPSGGSEEVIHSGESVPVVMVGRNVRVDQVESFDEVSCAPGSIGLIGGDDIMPLILNLTDRATFGTSRLSADDIPYRPQP